MLLKRLNEIIKKIPSIKKVVIVALPRNGTIEEIEKY